MPSNKNGGGVGCDPSDTVFSIAVGYLSVQTASFRDRAVYFDPTDTLVVADLHVGRDESSGVEFPLGERDDILERFSALRRFFEPDRIVVAGDVLHTFAEVSSSTVAILEAIEDSLTTNGVSLEFVVGNHDPLLTEVWDGPVSDALELSDGTVIAHGHEPPSIEADRYVIGHEHPTIGIEGVRRPCFLYGEKQLDDAELLVLPAFNRLAAGVEVNGMRTADFDSPFVTDADELRPIVYDEDAHETLRFPPLGEFRTML